MRKHFLQAISACVLLAVAFACGGTDPDDPEQQEQQQEETPEEKREKLSTAFLSAKETVANMGAGWNLGNTLDSNSGDTTNMWIERWTDRRPSDYETAWGQAVATGELMQMMSDAGFRSIRIPVTWYPHMGAKFRFDGNSTLWCPSQDPIGDKADAEWMARVKTVVDYVLAADMYCILNIHHDTGTANTHWIVASEESHALNGARFKSLWTQIAETFKDYDGRLLFEAFNEMTDEANSWCFASYGTPSHYDAAMAASAYAAVNAYAQDFVDAVRATGGNNTNRNLIVNTYAACSGEGTWNSHLKDPLKEMKLPSDKVDGHLIFQVHYYPSFSSLTEAKSSVDALIKGLNDNLAVKGAPVIIGEWGVGENSPTNYDHYRTTFLNFAQYLVERAKANGMATFCWMGVTDGQDRAVPKFTQPDLKDAIVKGAE